MKRNYKRKLDPYWDIDLYTVDEWERAVTDGNLNKHDGHGYWVKDGLKSVNDAFSTPKLDATHVVWYDRCMTNNY